MDINQPEIHAELTKAFLAYEAALVGNDVETLDRLFWASPEVVRFGPREALYGRDEILAFRKARPSAGLDRTLVRTVITTFGTDFGTAFAEFRRPGVERTGRQSQSWARIDGTWRIVAAHVSFEEV